MALLRMTSDALAGRETAYYPAGRATQRPATLAPGLGERPGDVLSDWARAAARLDDLLSTRRANHRDADRSLRGSWLLDSGDFRWTVSVTGDRTRSDPAGPTTDPARATIVGSRRDLLALLLGRPRRRPLRIEGDVEFGAAFGRAFPGP